MDRLHGRIRYWTTPPAGDCEAGSTTLRLHREIEGQSSVAAEIVFWDAAGQYFLETSHGDAPLNIIEALIAKAKEAITYK